MGQLEDLRAFVQIVELESIGKASKAAGIAKSAMSRKLRLLEERLQTELIIRTTRQWALTDAGRQYYERGLNLLTEVDEIEQKVRNESGRLQGRIRISVPHYFGKITLSRHLIEFAKLNPSVNLNIDFSDRIVDVVRENYDFVIRIANLPDSSLIARKLCSMQHVFCASPGYVSSCPPIAELHDLQQHKILQYGSAKRFNWKAKTQTGKLETVSLSASLNSDDGGFLSEAAVQSLGVIRLPDFMVESVLKSGKLVRILEQFAPEPLGIFAVYPATRYLPTRTRVFLDYLAARMTEEL